ncbi:MAG TPA: hypothetical protein PK246_10045 [Saprospiraceae bacterium]|nr:hypothetical protein [Saprospiraceae bacterium]
MISKWKQSLFNRRLKKISRSSDSIDKVITLDDALIIVNGDDFEASDDFERGVQKAIGITTSVRFLYYFNKRRKEVDSSRYYYCKDNLSATQIPKPEFLSEITSHRYKLLVLLSYHVSPHFLFLVHSIDAKLKLGINVEEYVTQSYFNIGIEVKNNSAKEVFKELSKVINLLTNQV